MWEGDYDDIGAEVARRGLVRYGKVAAAEAFVCPVGDLVGIGSGWLSDRRDLSAWGVAPHMIGVTDSPAEAL
jgi:hypothetical protein